MQEMLSTHTHTCTDTHANVPCCEPGFHAESVRREAGLDHSILVMVSGPGECVVDVDFV